MRPTIRGKVACQEKKWADLLLTGFCLAEACKKYSVELTPHGLVLMSINNWISKSFWIIELSRNSILCFKLHFSTMHQNLQIPQSITCTMLPFLVNKRAVGNCNLAIATKLHLWVASESVIMTLRLHKNNLSPLRCNCCSRLFQTSRLCKCR